jgi:adenylate cyclase
MRLSPFDPMNFNCLVGIGTSHCVAERYEEALSWLKKGEIEHPGLVWHLRVVATCLGQLGRTTEAGAAIEKYCQAYPGMTISKIMAHTPFRDADFRRRYAEGLLKAGLPE